LDGWHTSPLELDEPPAPAPPVELVLEPPPPTSPPPELEELVDVLDPPPPELEELELEAGSSPPHAATSARQEKTKANFKPFFMTASFLLWGQILN
jgi:hypothetical protein